MTEKRRPGRKPKAAGTALTAAIPRIRCLPETRAQFEALGGADWLRRIIAAHWKLHQAGKG